MYFFLFIDLSSECRHNLSLCRTHALCDSTNPDAGLQCRCNQGYYLRDLTCVPCQTSCEEGFYMTQQCGATNDVICKRKYLGLEKSTRPLVFTSPPGCRASENLISNLYELFYHK